jgi:ferritin-like metal-binding protein YciE
VVQRTFLPAVPKIRSVFARFGVNLDDEKATDQKLTAIAEAKVNRQTA